MSIGILIISLVFACIQGALCWLLLAFKPISMLLQDVSVIWTTGAIFGIGMVLTFIIIFIAGYANISDYAASFVSKHPGRTFALGVTCVVVVVIVSILGEMLYQATPLPPRTVNVDPDVCFVLDFSFSMNDDVEASAKDDRMDIIIETINAPANGNAYAAGEKVNYRITVKNRSPQTLYNIKVEALQSQDKWTIDSMEAYKEQVFDATYTMTVKDTQDDFSYYVYAYFDVSPDGWSTVENSSGKVGSCLTFARHSEKKGEEHILYNIVDKVTYKHNNLKEAFANTLNQMSGDSRVSVIIYRDEAKLLVDWTELTQEDRKTIIRMVEDETAWDATNFDRALAMADDQVKKALDEHRKVAVIMLSDGEDDAKTFKSVSTSAPEIAKNNVHVHTVLINQSVTAPSLVKIASESGGQFTATSANLAELTKTMNDAVDTITQEVAASGSGIPDTLITERYVSRKTIINASVLRMLILFLLGFFFKLIANICIGNNRTSIVPHLIKAVVIGALTAAWVEYGYHFGLPFLLVIGVYWILLIGQIITTD